LNLANGRYLNNHGFCGVGDYDLYSKWIGFSVRCLKGPPPEWGCGDPLYDDRDDQTYETVEIGEQCWMKENLNIGTRIDGANEMQDDSIIEKYCYDDDESNCDDYGGLFQWDEMMQYITTEGTQGICPTGWHLPSDTEWTQLTDFIGGTGSPHGNELKSCRQVNSPLGGTCNTFEHPRWVEDTYFGNYGTDDYGFSGLPGGCRFSDGTFYYVGYGGYWWSSTETSSYFAWFRDLYYDNGYVYVNDYNKQYGFSVRCLRDN